MIKCIFRVLSIPFNIFSVSLSLSPSFSLTKSTKHSLYFSLYISLYLSPSHSLHLAVLFLSNYRSLGQFHQHFTSSFYLCRSKKRKKDTDDLAVFFILLGSAFVKAARKMLLKLTPGVSLSFSPSLIFSLTCICTLSWFICKCQRHNAQSKTRLNTRIRKGEKKVKREIFKWGNYK